MIRRTTLAALLLILAGCAEPLPPQPATIPDEPEQCYVQHHQLATDLVEVGLQRLYINGANPGTSGGGTVVTLNWSADADRLERLQVNATWETGGLRHASLRFGIWSIGRAGPWPEYQGAQPLSIDMRVWEGTTMQPDLVIVTYPPNDNSKPVYPSISLEEQRVWFNVTETYRC